MVNETSVPAQGIRGSWYSVPYLVVWYGNPQQMGHLDGGFATLAACSGYGRTNQTDHDPHSTRCPQSDQQSTPEPQLVVPVPYVEPAGQIVYRQTRLRCRSLDSWHDATRQLIPAQLGKGKALEQYFLDPQQ
jgi:hypothetical protein